MKTYVFSASSTDAVAACAYPFKPGVELGSDTSGEGAATGTLVHALIENLINGVCDEPKAPTGADRVRAERIFAQWRDWWFGREESGWAWLPEVPYAICTATGAGRVLPSRGQRDYSAATPDEIPGTADRVIIRNGVAHIRDVKTTKHPKYTKEAKVNGQLRTLALAVARAHNVWTVRVGLEFASEFGCYLDEAEFDALDLDMWEPRLRELRDGVANARPVGGPHCTFCRVIDCNERPAKYRNEGRKRVA